MEMKSLSSYIWDFSAAPAEEYINFAVKHDVSVLYVQYDETVSDEKLAQFIRQANESAINVYALDGSAEWFTDEHGLQKFLQWVLEFQNEYRLFAGIHVDIEPYTLPNWESNKEQLLTQYIDMHKKVGDVANELSIFSEASVPFWFDEVSISGVVVSERLIDLLDRVVLMAYRNEAKGDDGIIAHVEHEMNYAEKTGGNIIVALETHMSFEGSDISFYGQSSKILMREAKAVGQHFKSYNSFNGIAIHHLDAWMVLK